MNAAYHSEPESNAKSQGAALDPEARQRAGDSEHKHQGAVRWVRDSAGRYSARALGAFTEADVLALAEDILSGRVQRMSEPLRPDMLKDWLRVRMGHLPREEMHVVWCDSRLRIIGMECLFTGSIHGAAIYPRELARRALEVNATYAVVAHNHPSGIPEPSIADHDITKQIKQLFGLLDVKLLDHVVVAATAVVSFAERGLI